MITVIVLLAVGILAGRVRTLPDGTARALDAFVINIALPGLVLALVPRLELSGEVAVPVTVAWAGLVVSAVAVLLLSRLFGWSRTTTGTLLLVVPLGNTSFLGIPAVEQLLGTDHLPYAIIYDQLGSFLALATYGAVIAGVYGAASTPGAGAIIKRVLTFPPFVALVVAVALIFTGVPDVVADVADRVGATVTPLTMVAVGMRLRLPRRDGSLAPLVAGLSLRMALIPAAVYAVALAVGGDGVVWDTTVLESAMPPMVSASVVAIDAGLDERLAANLVGVGVLAAMATLPLWSLLLT